MQNVVLEKPYEFVPPLDSRFWPAILRRYLPRYLRKKYGIHSVECRQVERLRASLDAGHGVLLAPNHCRLSDPLVLGELAMQAGTYLFAMASWHLFQQDRFQTFMIRRLGAFSVYREGMDRQAIAAAIDILDQARRPLVLFPEGAVSRHNDLLMSLMDGTAFIARTAARRRQKRDAGRVVVHPVAIRYFFRGDLQAAVDPVLTEIESHFSWQPRKEARLISRIGRVAQGLLALKEIEYLGHPRTGDLYERVGALIDHLLVPLEEEWGVGNQETSVVARVKRLRTAIVPEMVEGQIDDAERDRRWKQLSACYLAQQLSLYPANYIRRDDENVPEHILETVERFEEDLTDQLRVHGPQHAVIEVGEAIEVEPQRDRKAAVDPVMQGIEEQLTTMLDRLAGESQPLKL